MKEKFQIFIEVAGVLNRRLNIVPVLYGSLGLTRLVEETIDVNDVDILIPDEFIDEKWEDLKMVIEKLGFELVNIPEHEFVRDDQRIAFAEYSNLDDVDLTIKNLRESRVEDVSFYELNLEQYLVVYRYCLSDGYRETKHTDKEKIALIERSLETK